MAEDGAEDWRPTLPGLMVVGTDTEVGKTFVARRIAAACVQRGLRVAVYKPALSGWDADQPQLADDWQLWDAAGRPGELSDVCPQRFQAPLAPPAAAALEGRSIDENLLVEGARVFESDEQAYDIVIAEGAGGLLSPISDQSFVADVALRLGWPLIVVTANRLGMINHTLQTLVAAATFRDGLTSAGVIISDVTPLDELADPSRRSNAEWLERFCVPPILAHVSFDAELDALSAIDWLRVATHPIVD